MLVPVVLSVVALVTQPAHSLSPHQIGHTKAHVKHAARSFNNASSPFDTFLVHRQLCGGVPCASGPGSDCCAGGGCCPIGTFCAASDVGGTGCCPDGEECDGQSTGECADPGFVMCKNIPGGCCPEGWTCIPPDKCEPPDDPPDDPFPTETLPSLSLPSLTLPSFTLPEPTAPAPTVSWSASSSPPNGADFSVDLKSESIEWKGDWKISTSPCNSSSQGQGVSGNDIPTGQVSMNYDFKGGSSIALQLSANNADWTISLNGDEEGFSLDESFETTYKNCTYIGHGLFLDTTLTNTITINLLGPSFRSRKRALDEGWSFMVTKILISNSSSTTSATTTRSTSGFTPTSSAPPTVGAPPASSERQTVVSAALCLAVFAASLIMILA